MLEFGSENGEILVPKVFRVSRMAVNRLLIRSLRERRPHTAEPWTLDRLRAPVGVMLVVTDDHDRLRALDWDDSECRMQRLLRIHYGDGRVELAAGHAPIAIRERLEGYLAGDFAALDGIPVRTNGTAFQRAVWAALRGIPAGETMTYGDLARRLGRPRAARAVASCNGANPVGVVVPCHRVIGANGSLTGYAGGLARKRWLLAHERALFRRLAGEGEWHAAPMS
jgi:methylated-DNA-[protein]-cysteine S-methyltransferase